ncbi:polysaccharide deacetylase family protein [Halobacillus litoralis]|uniref:polysaccharide deacetylase family protein n=1 Tax=Halobacillus litoralis TaxID=45668 RepID=UPI001CFF52E4|nr:polysaccharide deacetylase family protein [Halobacillus litoralis]
MNINDKGYIKKVTRVGVFLLLFSLVNLFASSPAHAEMESTAYLSIDGKLVKTNYVMQEGHLMVPALFFKHTGATVDFNETYQSIAVERNNIAALPLEKNYMDYYVKEQNKWKRDYIKTTTTTINGSIYIPLLPTAQKLDMNVTYDPAIQRTFIETNEAPAEIPKAYNSGNTAQKKIALTFDDGPDQTITPQILDILKEKNVPATFFVVGQQVSYFPETARRIVKEGHTLANHSWDHSQLTKEYSSQVAEQVLSTNKIIKKVTGEEPTLFRPPYGDFTRADAQLFEQLGFRNILWSIDTLDWSGTTASEMIEMIDREKSPGAIVLQHSFSSSKLEGTVEALPQIIAQLRNDGYEFVTIDQMAFQ